MIQDGCSYLKLAHIVKVDLWKVQPGTFHNETKREKVMRLEKAVKQLISQSFSTIPNTRGFDLPYYVECVVSFAMDQFPDSFQNFNQTDRQVPSSDQTDNSALSQDLGGSGITKSRDPRLRDSETSGQAKFNSLMR